MGNAVDAVLGFGSGVGAADDETNLLPPTRLEPRTLLGRGPGRIQDSEAVGHMYASHVAGQLAMRDPHDRRTLIVGLGLDGSVGADGAGAADGEQRDSSRGAHFDMLELIQRVI